MEVSTEPGITKGIRSTLITVGALGLGYILYRQWQKNKEIAKANQASGQADNELSQLLSQGIRPSYDDSQYTVFVDQLVQAMTGCGTDESAIYGVFGYVKNAADIRKLIIAFGVQYYQPCAWTSPISYAQWQLNDHAFGGSLATWLGYDLSSSEIGKINSILASNGVNYSF